MSRQPETGVMATITHSICLSPRLADYGRAGAFRINSAHIDRSQLESMVMAIRRLPDPHLILLDTKGPELRTSDVGEPVTYQAGQRVELQFDSSAPCTPSAIRVDTPFIPHERPTVALIDDGRLRLRIVGGCTTAFDAVVEQGATIDARKSVSLPGVDTSSIPAVGPRDSAMVAFALAHAPVDMIAHSFVRSAADVEALRRVVGSAPVKIIAKIECREAVDRMEEILAAADGLLVARGDLSTAVDPATIPAIQLRAAHLCRREGKLCMVATQMLSSLQWMDRASRADVSDIALAVMEGMDWLLLCDETAHSPRGVEAIDTMLHVIDQSRRNNLQCLIC